MGSDLLALAMSRNSAARDELASRLTSMRRRQPLEAGARAQLDALLDELRDQVSPLMRAAIDVELSRGGAPGDPRGDLDADGGSLGNDELAAYAKTVLPHRLFALARKPGLASQIAAIIVSRGPLPALRALAANHEATIDAATLLVLAEASFQDERLRSCVISRPDLPGEIINSIWPHLSDAEKATLLRASAPYDERDAREIRAAAELEVHDAVRQGELPDSVDLLWARCSDNDMELDKAIVQLTERSRLWDLAELLARRLGVRWLDCLNLVAIPSLRGVGLLCRAAGLPQSSEEAIVRLRASLGFGRPPTQASPTASFPTNSEEAASRVLDLYARRERG